MADADNLDSLSNAELRKQMLAQGLPNVPVTDSSRKVLVKRLRASLGGNATVPAASASPKKTTTRRETLQPVAAAAAPVDKPDVANAAPKSRRTITATPSENKEAERRRKPETVAALPRVPEATVTITDASMKPVATAAPVAAPKAAPIQTRRSSNTERLVISDRVLKNPEVVAEKPVTKRSTENTLIVNSLIILESDEEEDEQLVAAAKNAEEKIVPKQPTVKPKTLGTQQAPRPKLMTTTTSTQEYLSKPLYPALEQQPLRRNLNYDETASQPLSQPIIQPSIQPLSKPFTQPLSQAPSTSTARPNTYTSYSHSGRYTSYVGPTALSYGTGSAVNLTSAAGSGYRRSPPRTYTNEFSDDTADEEPAPSTHFESDFARKLAALRSERIGDRSSTYNRRTMPSSGYGTGAGYDPPAARRSLRREDANASVQFRRFWDSLNNSYNLNAILFILFVLLLIYVVFRLFN